jgi:FKBP-type peptidyl-prolyl cis-trans isomerase FklB
MMTTKLYFLLVTIVFTVTAVAVDVTSSYEASKKFLLENSKKPNVVTLPSGLQYKIMRTGLGKHHPEHTSPTDCHYKGTLIDGVTTIDSSYDRKQPAMFQPRQVIKGWTEAMSLMVEGDKWELYIPSKLAYGDKGSGELIKPGDALIFTMEMIYIRGTKRPDEHVVRCRVKSPTKKNCNEKEIEYIKKSMDKFISIDDNGGSSHSTSNSDAGTKKNVNIAAIEKEIERLTKISVKGSDEVIDWCNRRIRILNQIKGGEKRIGIDTNINIDEYILKYKDEF